MITKEQVTEVMKEIQDPELNLDIWTLGLIYEIDVEKSPVFIKMTFTSPMCPYGPVILDEVKTKMKEKFQVETEVEVTFDPVWEPSEEVRELLGV
jgi:metal-sulfur cluster biosynthetic enzyme